MTEESDYFFHPIYINYGIQVYDDIPTPVRIVSRNDDDLVTIQKMKPTARCCDGYIGVSLKGKPFYYFHRFILECIEGRELEKDEEVDHIDGVKFHNNISNLQILSHNSNMKKIQCLNYHCFVVNRDGDVKEFFNLYDIVMYTDVSGPIIYAILSGKIVGKTAINNAGERYKIEKA